MSAGAFFYGLSLVFSPVAVRSVDWRCRFKTESLLATGAPKRVVYFLSNPDFAINVGLGSSISPTVAALVMGAFGFAFLTPLAL